MLEPQQMKQVGIVVLGLAFVLWCWRSTRHAEEELLSPGSSCSTTTRARQRRARNKRTRRKNRSRTSSPTNSRRGLSEDDECETEDDENAAEPLDHLTNSGDEDAAAACSSPVSRPTSPRAGMNDELRFIAQTSMDGTRVLKLESRSLADQGDSPSTRAFYEILGRYSDIVAEAEAATPPATPNVPQPQPPTEAVLSRHNSLKRPSKVKKPMKRDPKSPFASSPEVPSSQSSSEEHEEEDVDEDDDLNHTTGSLPPPRTHHRPPLHHGRRGRLSMNSSSSRRYARSSVSSLHTRSTRSSFHESQNMRNSAQGFALSPALSSNGLPPRRSSAQNYYTSGYRSENSSLRRSTDSSSVRARAFSATRSPNTLPAPNTNHHQRRVTASGSVLPPKSAPGAQTPYDPAAQAPASNSPSTSRRNSHHTHQPSALSSSLMAPPAYSSPGNSVQSASAASPQRAKSTMPTSYTSPGPAVPGGMLLTDNGLDTEWEETDSMSDAFSLAESFDNDSTASNRVYATANVAAFSESDSLYRDEHIPLNRAAQHTERISRLKQLRESRRIPLSLQRCPPTNSHSSGEAGAASTSTPATPMVFGPYANDSHAQDFFGSAGGVPMPTPPAPAASASALSDVEEEITEEEAVMVTRSSAMRLVTVTQ